MSIAPVVLFVYNRLEHTKNTIDSLIKNNLSDRTELFIFSDYYKTEFEKQKVFEVRNYIHSIKGFKNINIIERDNNLGLAKSIISGVSQVINIYKKIIVLEDDLITAPNFIEYMNYALNKYEENKSVYSVTGYSFLNNLKESTIPSTYFAKLTCSWSWGTWYDRWEKFDVDANGWKKIMTDKKLKNLFNYDSTYDYSTMIKKQMDGKIDSWAIRWYFTVFQNEGLTLYPRQSLVNNTGFDGSGTHCGIEDQKFILTDFNNIEYTDEIIEKPELRELIKLELKNNRVPLIKKIINKLKKW